MEKSHEGPCPDEVAGFYAETRRKELRRLQYLCMGSFFSSGFSGVEVGVHHCAKNFWLILLRKNCCTSNFAIFNLTGWIKCDKLRQCTDFSESARMNYGLCEIYNNDIQDRGRENLLVFEMGFFYEWLGKFCTR